METPEEKLENILFNTECIVDEYTLLRVMQKLNFNGLLTEDGVKVFNLLEKKIWHD
jgi:hypothetical protein